MPKLAIKGGLKVRNNPFPNMSTIGQSELNAARRVILTGNLSGFRGNSGPGFQGGPEVRALEKEWEKKFGVKHAIAVNSCTSGLHIACIAIDLKPGDEVIVTPWSMSCSATAPMICGAIPIFADIEEDYYCLDPQSIRDRISARTKAIIVVDLFGQPHDYSEIRKIADEYSLSIIEDAAQAIGSYYGKRSTGTLGDIGVYSFTQGKHITCGEGGMIVTNDDKLAMSCMLLRNHAEAVENDLIGSKPNYKKYTLPTFDHNLFGFNMRMTEIQAAILREQLKYLDGVVEKHQKSEQFISDNLSHLDYIIKFPKVRPYSTHSYYVQALKWRTENKHTEGIHRDQYIEAVRAELSHEEGRAIEGVPISYGYIKPLYLFPIFQNYQDKLDIYKNEYEKIRRRRIKENYTQGSCPVAERLWKNEIIINRLVGMNLMVSDLKDVVNAFIKVWENRDELR